MTSRRRRRLAWAIPITVIVIGIVVALNGMATPATFGWVAYQPLSDASFIADANGMFVSRATAIGAAIVALGLMLVAFLAGYRARGRLESSSRGD